VRRVHVQRNLLASVSKANKPVVSAVVKTVFAEKDCDQAYARWREVADSLRERFRDVAERMDEAKHDVLTSTAFGESLRLKRHSTNALERVPKTIKQRTNVFGIVSNCEAVTRLVGALMLGQYDEWTVSHGSMQVQ
jgi:transposase-like protein